MNNNLDAIRKAEDNQFILVVDWHRFQRIVEASKTNQNIKQALEKLYTVYYMSKENE